MEKMNEIRQGFDSLVKKLGTLQKDSVTPFEFKYDGPVPILGVKSFCGCTSLKVIGGHTIVGEFQASSIGKYTRQIAVYFDDGQDFYKIDENKVIENNTKKLNVLLMIDVEVVE